MNIQFDEVAGGINGFYMGFPAKTGEIKKGFCVSFNRFGKGGIVLTEKQALKIAHFIISEVEKNKCYVKM